ncbi:MAG: hypothetical protein Q4D14_03635 [Bacteroidales bacterium]|nr:hypothetical protein [Bacteroidales bacterium]
MRKSSICFVAMLFVLAILYSCSQDNTNDLLEQTTPVTRVQNQTTEIVESEAFENVLRFAEHANGQIASHFCSGELLRSVY